MRSVLSILAGKTGSLASITAVLAVLALAVVTVLSLFARHSWFLELFTHFRPQLALASALVAGVIFLWRCQALGAVSLALLLVNGAPLLPYLDGLHAAPAPRAGYVALSVMTLNLHGRYGDVDKALALITRESPDVLLLTEVPLRRERLVAGLEALYPHRLDTGGLRGEDVLLLSRWAPRHAQIDRSVHRRAPVLVADLCAPQGAGAPERAACVRLAGLHAAQPLGPKWTARRNAALGRAAQHLKAGAYPGIVMGDFNLTPWAPSFTRLIDSAGLVDTGTRRGLSPTWLVRNPFLFLFIDHILVAPEIEIVASAVGPYVGSDHRPVSARLGVPVKAQ